MGLRRRADRAHVPRVIVPHGGSVWGPGACLRRADDLLFSVVPGILCVMGTVQPLRILSLDLAVNGLGPGGASALGKLRASASLHDLHLSLEDNPLGDAGAQGLAELKNAPSLRRLHLVLRRCGLGSAGACALAELRAIPKLERSHLLLVNNPLGGVASAPALREFQSQRCCACALPPVQGHAFGHHPCRHGGACLGRLGGCWRGSSCGSLCDQCRCAQLRPPCVSLRVSVFGWGASASDCRALCNRPFKRTPAPLRVGQCTAPDGPPVCLADRPPRVTCFCAAQVLCTALGKACVNEAQFSVCLQCLKGLTQPLGEVLQSHMDTIQDAALQCLVHPSARIIYEAAMVLGALVVALPQVRVRGPPAMIAVTGLGLCHAMCGDQGGGVRDCTLPSHKKREKRFARARWASETRPSKKKCGGGGGGLEK